MRMIKCMKQNPLLFNKLLPLAIPYRDNALLWKYMKDTTIVKSQTTTQLF